MKRILSIALTLCMALSLLTFPANAASDKAKAAADELHELGLFGGVGTNADGSINYDLDRAPSRAEGVTMLVRMLGKEDEAKAGAWTTPFSDVADWAKPYVGYAYTNGLTNGVGDDGKGGQLFGSNATINATQYLTFVLRSLGYESGKDFQWDKAWELTDELGITNGEYNASTNSSFLRSDIALVSLAAHEKSAEPPVMTANVTGKNYKIDGSGNLTVTGQQLYLENINIAGDFTVPSGMIARQIILSNVNVGGTIKVQNKNTTLWTDGKAAEIVISAESCNITARGSVKVTEASGAKDSIINKTSDNPHSAVSMSANGDIAGVPDKSPFTLALVSGEDISLHGWNSKKPGSVINAFSSLLGRAATQKGFRKLTVDKVIAFGTISTSYVSRYSLGAAKVLNDKPVTVIEGAPVHISVTKSETGYIVKATTPSELNENAAYNIHYGIFTYEKHPGGSSVDGLFTAAQLIEGVETDIIRGDSEGNLVFVSGWYVNANGEVVLSDGYPVGVKAPN